MPGRKIGDRNPNVHAALRKLMDELVADERGTSRHNLLILVPYRPDEEIQVIQNGITVQLDSSLTATKVFMNALEERKQQTTLCHD